MTSLQGTFAQQMSSSSQFHRVHTSGENTDHVPTCILFRKGKKTKEGKRLEPSTDCFFFLFFLTRGFVLSSSNNYPATTSVHLELRFEVGLLDPRKNHERKDIGHIWDWSVGLSPILRRCFLKILNSETAPFAQRRYISTVVQVLGPAAGEHLTIAFNLSRGGTLWKGGFPGGPE